MAFVELTASGGLNPRHFSLNSNGSLLAVANQVSRSVVVWSREIETGKVGKQAAAAFNLGPGELRYVVCADNRDLADSCCCDLAMFSGWQNDG